MRRLHSLLLLWLNSLGMCLLSLHVLPNLYRLLLLHCQLLRLGLQQMCLRLLLLLLLRLNGRCTTLCLWLKNMLIFMLRLQLLILFFHMLCLEWCWQRRSHHSLLLLLLQ
uniref:Uncharacterized protein n=1 Tax=Anopheles braziliensis TaxID=58242 RepID=A0A2M3ZKN6_9DIPT